jgi:hypothetical protein
MPVYDCGDPDCRPCEDEFRGQAEEPRTTGIDDVEWLDAKVCEQADEIERLRVSNERLTALLDRKAPSLNMEQEPEK